MDFPTIFFFFFFLDQGGRRGQLIYQFTLPFMLLFSRICLQGGVHRHMENRNNRKLIGIYGSSLSISIPMSSQTASCVRPAGSRFCSLLSSILGEVKIDRLNQVVGQVTVMQ